MSKEKPNSEQKKGEDEWDEKSKDVFARMDKYRKEEYKHRKPYCKDYKKMQWCKHYKNAEMRKFGKEIDLLLEELIK